MEGRILSRQTDPYAPFILMSKNHILTTLKQGCESWKILPPKIFKCLIYAWHWPDEMNIRFKTCQECKFPKLLNEKSGSACQDLTPNSLHN